MTPVKRISLAALASTAGIAGLISAVAAHLLYGSFPRITLLTPVMLYIMTVVCGVAGNIIKRRIGNAEIGLDRSQLSPLAVANWFMLGQATAWIGAVFVGIYAGIAIHIIPRAADLAVAEADVPGVIAGIIGAVACAGAGLYLERACEAPPGAGDATG